MPRVTNGYGNPIDSVISWLLKRPVADKEMAKAIKVSGPTYSRRKNDDNFPSFEELQLLGKHFDISPRVLQIAFGHLEDDVVSLLDEAELYDYRRVGGDVPHKTTRAREIRHHEPSFTHRQ